MRRWTSHRMTLAWISLILVGLGCSASAVRAGTYDPATKSFALNYIFLDLPSGVLDEAQVSLSREATLPTPAQAATVQTFLKLVSDKLFLVTKGRAKIGSLTEVSEVKKADVVISLTGSVRPLAGGAWASQLGFTQGGTLNLYYQDLQLAPSQDDIANTVVHELCHYFFGLPDEYPGGSDSRRFCPLDAPGLQRCLMDNFHYGFLGRLCDTDHNAAAPGISGSGVVEPRNFSCERIVTDFFDNFRVKADSGVLTVPSAVNSGLKRNLTPAETESVIKPAREALAKLKTRRGSGLLNQADRKYILGHIVSGLVETLKEGLKGIDVPKVAESLVGSLILTPLGAPPGLQAIEKVLLSKAFDLAKDAIARNGGVQGIEDKLLEFAKGELKKISGASPLGVDDVNFIHDLASQTASGTLPNSPGTAQQLRDELFIELLETLNSIANNLNFPGAIDRGNVARRVIAELQQQGKIPNRALKNRFGRRRTVLIEPPILDRGEGGYPLDLTPTQGNPTANYNDLRAESKYLFTRLIDRTRITAFAAASAPVAEVSKIEVKMTDLSSRDVDHIFKIDKFEGISARQGDKPQALEGKLEGVLAERKQRIFELLAVVKDHVERDLIENIVILVPPNGVPDDFAVAISSLGEEFIGKADLRIDIALVGSTATIPAELRDLVVRSEGSILTVTDIDEVGAIAQRLAGEQSQGSLITIPEQGMLLIDKAVKPLGAGQLLFERMQGQRVPHTIRTGDAGQPAGLESNVVLRSFYVDDSNDYELIFGVSKPLTIAGLSKTWKVDHSANGEDFLPTDANRLLPSPENVTKFPAPMIRLMRGRITDPKDVKEYEDGTRAIDFAQTREITLDPGKSTAKTLVFRLSATRSGSGIGWFTPILSVVSNNFRDAVVVDPTNPGKVVVKLPSERAVSPNAADAVVVDPTNPGKVAVKPPSKLAVPPDQSNAEIFHYTFSVGTPRSKAQLKANLIQVGPNGGPVTQLGTIGSNETEVIITAIPSAGAAVIKAEVIGFVQKIDIGTNEIQSPRIDFKDDGVAPDKVADDGIYTGKILLEVRRPHSAEYRVFIDAHTVEEKTKFVPAGEAIAEPDQVNQKVAPVTDDPLNRASPMFQRATSLHFSVPSNRSR